MTRRLRLEFSTSNPDELLVRAGVCDGLEIYEMEENLRMSLPAKIYSEDKETLEILDEIQLIEAHAKSLGQLALINPTRVEESLGGESAIREALGDAVANRLSDLKSLLP